MDDPVDDVGVARKEAGLGVRKFASDVAVRGLFQMLNALKGLLLLPLIAKLFGATGYGIWSQVTLTITLLAPLLTLRLDSALVRYLGGFADRRERASAFFGSAAVVWMMSLGIFALGLVAKDSIAQIMFADPGLSAFSVLFVLFLVARGNLTFVLSYYRAKSAIRLYTVLQTVQIVGEVAILYGLSLLCSSDLADALLALIFVDGVLLIGMLGDIIRRDGFALRIPWPAFKRLFRYSLPLIPAGAMYWVVNSSDRYVIVHFLGLDQAGVYSAAYRLAQILNLMLQPISFVLLPLVSTLWERGETERAHFYLSHSLFWFFVFAMPAAVGLIAIGPTLLKLLGTEEFVVGSSLVALLVSGELCVAIYQIYVYIIYLHEKTWIQPILFAVLGVFNLGFNLLLVPLWGLMGAAATTFVSYAGQLGFVYLYSRRLMVLSLPLYAMVKVTLGSGMAFATTVLVPQHGVGGVVSKILVGAVVYAVFIWLTRAAPVGRLWQLVQGGKKG